MDAFLGTGVCLKPTVRLCPWLVGDNQEVLASECGLWVVCQKDHRSYASVSARQMLNDNWREKGGRPILVICTSL